MTSAAEPQSRPVTRPLACHVMAKPSGAVCNLDCTYCFYLEKDKLYPDLAKNWRMGDATLEAYVAQYIDAQDVPAVNFAWQGGEPTLMGLEFFRSALQLQRKHANGKTITNAIQTNGVLLDDDWGEFLAKNEFLVGISIDGPPNMHDRYRVDKGEGSTFERVMSGLEVLKRHEVEFNTLTVLNNVNVRQPLRVYRFLKSIGSRYMQFIPIVERRADAIAADQLSLVGPDFEAGAQVTEWSVKPDEYGRFLRTVFDTWVLHDVGEYFVQAFDAALAAWTGQPAGICIFAETCGDALIIEHNGDLYSCDHYVYPEFLLGNVDQQSIREMVTSEKQVKFGRDKRDTLPEYCRKCEYRFACNGGCPKQRFLHTPDGEPGLHYLCRSYKAFFSHADPYMRFMAGELRNRRPAAGVMEWARNRSKAMHQADRKRGR